VNFGTILNAMTKHCISLVVEGQEDNSKILAREFTKYVRIKEILNVQFKVYHSLNTSCVQNKDDARLFVSETINTLKKYSFSDIKIYNAILETKFSPPKLKSTTLNSNIGNLIKFATSSNGNVEQYINSLMFVTEHLQLIKKDEGVLKEINNKLANISLKFLEPKHVVRIAIKKFNSEFEILSENDRLVFNILRSNDDKEIEKLFSSQLTEIDKLMNNYNLINNFESELSNKIIESLKILRKDCTQKNILNGYELLEELRELNK